MEKGKLIARTCKLFTEDLDEDSVAPIRPVRPQKCNIVLPGLRNDGKPVLAIQEGDYLLLGDGGEAVDIFALSGAAQYADGITSKDAESDIGWAEDTVKGDGRIVKSVLKHGWCDS